MEKSNEKILMIMILPTEPLRLFLFKRSFFSQTWLSHSMAVNVVQSFFFLEL